MMGFNWTSPDEDGKLNVTSETFIGNTQVAGPGVTGSTRAEVCTDITLKLGKKWKYVLENTVGHDTETPLAAGGFGPASWTGFTNYLLYDINDCWAFGIRYEHFEDLDGAVVAPVSDPSASPNVFNLEPGSKWNDLTLGLNWKPNKNVTCRTEARWDWATNTAPAGGKPFADGSANGQFLWGNDIIVRF